MIGGFEDGETLTETLIPHATTPVRAELADHIADLAAIQLHTDTELRVPAEIDAGTIDAARTIRWLIEGNGKQVDHDHAVQLTLGGQVTADEAEGMRRKQNRFP